MAALGDRDLDQVTESIFERFLPYFQGLASFQGNWKSNQTTTPAHSTNMEPSTKQDSEQETGSSEVRSNFSNSDTNQFVLVNRLQKTLAMSDEKLRTSRYNKVHVRFLNQPNLAYCEVTGDRRSDINIIHPKLFTQL